MVKWNLGITKILYSPTLILRNMMEYDHVADLFNCNYNFVESNHSRKILGVLVLIAVDCFCPYPYQYIAEKNSCKENPFTRPADPAKIYG